jgi:hypothetical protein
MVLDFFRHMRPPAMIDSAPAPGELTRLEYGGYVKLGLRVGAGYRIKGTASFRIGELALSEDYGSSVLGSLGLRAEVAGAFAVEVRGGSGETGQPRAGWARVIVRKSRGDTFGVAADVALTATSEIAGVPESPNEFLGALLGVNVKNWLHVLERVHTLSDWNALKAELDPLAKKFIGEWVGQAFNDIGRSEVPALLGRAKRVVEDYRAVDDAVITAFDRYFDELTAPEPGNDIARAVQRLAQLPSWGSLGEDVDPTVWRLVTELTDGDPLSSILAQDVSHIRKRAQRLLELGSASGHAEIREVTMLAKRGFGLPSLLTLLRSIHTTAALKAAITTRAGAFIERLTGQAVDALNDSELEPIRKRLQDLLGKVSGFETTAYEKLKESIVKSASLTLHAEYSRASHDDALVDAEVNVGTDEGREIMRACARGDFDRALSRHQPHLVRVNRGRLVHSVTTRSGVAVNVLGWHLRWKYSAMDQLILNAEQRIVSEGNGAISVYTRMDVTTKRDRRRHGERTLTNFLLRFLGETHGVLEKDPAGTQYLIDVISRMSARYQLSFDDPHTTAEELAYYVSFAEAFGLAQRGLQPERLAALLPKTGADDFGPISARYDVRYAEAALRRLFREAIGPDIVRRVVRRTILGSYLRRDEGLRNTGWAYWTAGVYDLWKHSPAGFVKTTPQVYHPIDPSPFPAVPAPASARVDPPRQLVLNALYFIEDSFVSGLATLQQLIARGTAGQRLTPSQFEDALDDFAGALQQVDQFDELENGVFAIFDELQRRAAPSARTSSLTLESRVDGRPVTKVFLPPV